MRLKLIPFLLVALFSSAHPTRVLALPFTIDGSTVYVNAGFVGIRTSTPTTALDVNGDAQFGSGPTKSTITATGLLKLTSSGILWADESTSTTAFSSGGSGSGFQVIATTAANSDSSIGFTNLSSSKTYEVVYNLTQVTGGSTVLLLRFNGDTGSNYKSANSATTFSGGSCGSVGLTGTYINLNGESTGTFLANDYYNGRFTIQYVSGQPNTLTIHGTSTFQYGSSAQWCTDYFGGRYAGSAAPSSMTLAPSGGTFSGTVVLLERQ